MINLLFQVSGDENKRRAFDTRRIDEWERKLEQNIKQKKRQRKRKRLLKALENIEKVEEREKELLKDDYNYFDDYQDYLNNNPDSIQDKLDYGSGPGSGPGTGSPLSATNPTWPRWDDFINKMDTLKNSNSYLGSHSGLNYNPVWLRNYLKSQVNPTIKKFVFVN